MNKIYYNNENIFFKTIKSLKKERKFFILFIIQFFIFSVPNAENLNASAKKDNKVIEKKFDLLNKNENYKILNKKDFDKKDKIQFDKKENNLINVKKDILKDKKEKNSLINTPSLTDKKESKIIPSSKNITKNIDLTKSQRVEKIKEFKELFSKQESKTNFKKLSKSEVKSGVEYFILKKNNYNFKNQLNLDHDEYKKAKILLKNLDHRINKIINKFKPNIKKTGFNSSLRENKDNEEKFNYIYSLEEKSKIINYAEKVLQAMGKF